MAKVQLQVWGYRCERCGHEWLPRDFRDGIRVLYHTVAALSEPDESTKKLAMPMVEDPLQWHYRTVPGLRRRLARAQHLSVTSGFLGPRTMRALGLPAYVPPWYPVVRMPVNLARSVAAFVGPTNDALAAPAVIVHWKAAIVRPPFAIDPPASSVTLVPACGAVVEAVIAAVGGGTTAGTDAATAAAASSMPAPQVVVVQ